MEDETKKDALKESLLQLNAERKKKESEILLYQEILKSVGDSFLFTFTLLKLTLILIVSFSPQSKMWV